MKTVLLSVFLCALTVTVHGQRVKDHKPLSHFNRDTVEYLKENFQLETRTYSYRNETVQDLVNDLQVPVKSVMIEVIYSQRGERAKVPGVMLMFQDLNRIKGRTKTPYGVYILFNWEEMWEYADYFKPLTRGHTSNFCVEWNEEAARLLGPMKIVHAYGGTFDISDVVW